MLAKGDPLLARAAAALRSARAVSTQTRQIVDTVRLERLQRELVEKIVQIERVVSRDRSDGTV
ncbi:MAG TPA: hypothetical protein VGA84_12845 [Thermoanaerobaculia bacterium]